ncbi:lysosome-associated membrane glycoprotein 1 [Sceloporus undulatus]|uniref:lysosome-associated membrane glycoprotein 1 n=1 Tax=Sceloporus undulatus TaxID=8520 RepID=UPI001C4D48EF|nr:lysosome-associated membrane glycoprotein 1 [Sceloporus undulatus]
MAARGLLLAAALLGLLQASSTFEVKDKSGKICILANFSVQFTVEYNTKTKTESKSFLLPVNAHVIKEASSCSKEKETSQVLVVGFGAGHSLHLMFEKNADSYMISNLTFSYNLSDTSLFPDSSGGQREASKAAGIQAELNTTYRCHNIHRINMQNVTVLFSNVTLEAYLPNNTFSKNDSTCAEDNPTTVAPPVTTHIPTTSSLAPPTTTPTTNPDIGRYNVSGSQGICLLATMGLQVSITYSTKNKTVKSEVLNLPPNTTHSGTCDNSTVTLNLTSGSTSLSFQFMQNVSAEKYFLQGIVVTANLPLGATEKNINAFNHSLNALKATVGKSYKCVAEESIWISANASVNIYNIQLQVFKISGDKFGAVEECQLDENNMLIPIIVGAALAGLVLIVLIAYLIGRKRSHAGYQTI